MKLRKAERIFQGNIISILQHGALDKNPRPKYSDGTPAHTLFITDVFEKYGANEVPITETRPIAWKSSIREALWIYQSQTTNLDVLRDEYKITWWDDWAVNGGHDVGQVYGETVKRYDLMNKLLKGLKEDPFGRRNLINLWQEKDFEEPHGLKPCAYETMWAVREDQEGNYVLDLHLNQRSSDYLTAGHVNLVQYKALQMMVAKHLGYKVGTFSRHVMNMHIYDRHIEQAEIILDSFEEVENKGSSVEFKLNVPDGTNFYDIKESDFELKNYKPVKHKPKLTFDLGI